MLRQSQELARRLERHRRSEPRGRIAALSPRTGPRCLIAAELDALTAYATKHGLAHACRLLFNTNEFVFVD